MFEAVQTFDVNNENLTKNGDKLRIVKLGFLALTLGFTMTVTVLVSEDQSILSKLKYSYEPAEFPITLGSTFCENKVQFKLRSELYATPCRRKRYK